MNKANLGTNYTVASVWWMRGVDTQCQQGTEAVFTHWSIWKYHVCIDNQRLCIDQHQTSRKHGFIVGLEIVNKTQDWDSNYT